MKAVEIAKTLGVSKATVSLALNGKPGISEKTRRRILSYAARMAEELPDDGDASAAVPGMATTFKPVIRIISPLKSFSLTRSPEPGLLPDSIPLFERAASRLGYSLEVHYPDFLEDPIEQIIEDCSDPAIRGVVLFASELTGADIARFHGIQKPMVLYDNESPSGLFSSVTIDNRSAARLAVDYFCRKGIRDIGYLAMSGTIYNFEERRAGFFEAMASHNLACTPLHMIPVGKNIDECYQKIKTDWPKMASHQAYLMESYHISVGALHAFRDLGVRIPEDVSLIGIDLLPSYLMGDCILTTIKVPHEDRAALAISLLDNEIHGTGEFRSHIRTSCRLTAGNSVACIDRS